MPQFIKASICFSRSLVPGALPVAAQTLHIADPAILITNLTWHWQDWEQRLTPDTFVHGCVWGMQRIPQLLGNASNPACFWMMLFPLGLDSAWLSCSLHVKNSSINHTWLGLSEGIETDEELFISLAGLLDLLQSFLVFVKCEAMLLFWKPHWTSVTTHYYTALKYKWSSPGLSGFTYLEVTTVKKIHTTSLWSHVFTKRDGGHTQGRHVKLFLSPTLRGMWHIGGVKHKSVSVYERTDNKARGSQCCLSGPSAIIARPHSHWIMHAYE